jgi:Cdc6-like AAA superfamily ATPase
MSEFVKSGENVYPKPQGIDYDLEIGRIYRLKTIRHGFNKSTVLIADGNIELPEKVYNTDDEELFISRIINYFNKHNKNTTGAVLYGRQGCGKTLFAKYIAKKVNLPVIIIDPSFNTKDLIEYFTKFNTSVCIIFDELDKHDEYWDTKEMLEFLDGIQTTCKKLVLFTCNNDDTVNQFMKNRCGRIRYYRKFDKLKKDMIINILTDKLNNKDNIKSIAEIIYSNISLPSYDNVTSIIDEINDYPEIDVLKLITDMNVSIC